MDNNNIHNPFIGLRTYEESDAIFFRGRKSSTLDLYGMIAENDVVVLHAESGEGKSSLLNAGLFPMLRDERFFPIKINFTEEDYALDNPNFDEIVYQRIIDSIAQINCDSSDTDVFRESPSLNGKVSIIPVAETENTLSNNYKLRQCAWWLLRNYTLNAYGASLIPVLVFDQFEEVFARPKSNTWTEDFFLWLSSTLNDTVPQNVIESVREIIGEDADFPKIKTNKKFKALFSLRTEYIGELDYWGIQRHHISVLKNSRYCLKPLTELEADEVLELQPFFTSQIREQIKSAIRSSHGSKRIQSNLPTIPAMLLSVVSTTASTNIAKNGHAFDNLTEIDDNTLSSDLFTNIIDQFYQKEVIDANIPKKVIKHIEDILVDDKGKRVRIKADSKELRKLNFEGKYKPLLEQKRLIKCTQINGDEYVELTHDALAKVIIKKRNIVQLDKSRWNNYIVNGSYCLLILFAIMYWFSILAKDYIYGGYDAMREYHYVTTNLFKKIIICAGFVPIVYWGINWYRKAVNYKRKIWATVTSYIILSTYYFSSLYLINYIAYPNHTWFHNGALTERLYFQLIYVVVGSILICLGCLLINLRLYVKAIRWPMIFGILLIIGTLSPLIYTVRPVISYILITTSLFYCVSYILKKEKNICVLSLIAIGLLILSIYIFEPYGDLPKYCIIAIIAIIIGYFFYGLTLKKDFSFRIILSKIVSHKELLQTKLISVLYGIYTICIIGFLCVAFGYRLNDLYSLIALIVICPLLIHLLSNYVLPIQGRGKHYFLYAACLLSVVALWGAQYINVHFWANIFIWLLGILAIYYSSTKLLENANNKKLKNVFNSILIYIFVSGVIPFLLMGYNIMAFNYNSKVYNKTEYIKNIDTKLLYVRNTEGKLGLMSRNGDIIIPTNYDQIIPSYNTTYENLWDDNYKTKTNFWGFILIEDWQISEWYLDAFVQNGKLMSYSEWLINPEDSADGQNIDKSIEENRIKNQIVRLIKANNKIISDQTDWRFNHKDSTHLQLLNNIDFDSVAPNLSATSVSFQKCYLDTILPNLNFEGYGLVSNVLSKSYLWDDIIEKNAVEAENSEKIRNGISDNITGKMLAQRELGDRLCKLATTYAKGGKLKEAEYLSRLSFTKGKYNDSGKALYLRLLLDQNKVEDALTFIRRKENELFNETSGIFPEEEYSWIHIRYTPLIRHIPRDYRDILINHGYKFEIKDMLPFDMIQLLPDSINGDMYRYFRTFPLPNGNSRTYSYFVKDGARVTPPLSFWSLFMNYGDPILAINCITKKRQFIKPSDIIGDAYAYAEIYEDGSSSRTNLAYSQKYLNHLIEGGENKYKITKTCRHSGNHPATFISPQLIKGEYNHAWPFSEGLAAVEINDKIGFINTDGNIVIEPKYQSPFRPQKGFLGSFYQIYSTGKFYNPYFRNGVCPVYDDFGNLIWIDKSGKRTKEPNALPPKGIE